MLNVKPYINDFLCSISQVSKSSTVSQTNCKCSEANQETNTYGGGFQMPKVNKIDFKRVFSNFSTLLAANPGVFSTMFAILGVYFLAAVWARRADRKDIEKVQQCFT